MHSIKGDRYLSYTLHPVYLDGALLELIVFGRDITERIKAEQEVLRLNASLEARIQERTRALQVSMDTVRNLTMMVTHDLKTPLHEIGIYAGEIGKGQDVTENAERIRGLSADMTVMIGELLEYDRISNTEPDKETVDIKSMIETAFSALKKGNAVLEFETGIARNQRRRENAPACRHKSPVQRRQIFRTPEEPQDCRRLPQGSGTVICFTSGTTASVSI